VRRFNGGLLVLIALLIFTESKMSRVVGIALECILQVFFLKIQTLRMIFFAGYWLNTGYYHILQKS
jgi:hypothetical protein